VVTLIAAFSNWTLAFAAVVMVLAALAMLRVPDDQKSVPII